MNVFWESIIAITFAPIQMAATNVHADLGLWLEHTIQPNARISMNVLRGWLGVGGSASTQGEGNVTIHFSKYFD